MSFPETSSAAFDCRRFRGDRNRKLHRAECGRHGGDRKLRRWNMGGRDGRGPDRHRWGRGERHGRAERHAGNGQQGIVAGNATIGTVIAGNFIGTTADGLAPIGNGPSFPGIKLYQNTQNVRVGTNGDGTGDVAERNVISGKQRTRPSDRRRFRVRRGRKLHGPRRRWDHQGSEYR